MNKRTFKKCVVKTASVMMALLIMLSSLAVLPSAIITTFAADSVTYSDPRLELDFNNNWKFNLGEESGAYAKAYDDSAWETVELPHDFSIIQDFTTDGTDAESGNLPGGVGWYRKMFILPTEYKGRRIIINFDGAYNHTEVYVNGTLVGENHYGYNAFSFDITDYVDCNGVSVNFICVRVENQFPSSRWYSGSGIYRDVTMTIINPVHVDLYGTYITTPNLESTNGSDGTLDAKVTIANDNATSQTVTVETKILDASGAEVGTSASADVTVAGASSQEVTLNPALSDPNLWSTDTPYLYTLRTTVTQDGAVVDEYDTEFGYRWINWDITNGFYLNGEAVKLQGVCMHHDQGALGAVQVYDALYRQIAILKDMGVNTIRTSHNTPSDILMDICNEQGILVMNEFFDGWDTAKNSNNHDFSEYFDTVIDSNSNLLGLENGQMWYEFVLTQSVKRDRNAPCVIIWDVGNEISEGASEGDFGTIAQNMRSMLDTLDPTRPVCEGNNQRNITSGWPANVEQYMTVIGGNYQPGTWESMQSQISSHADAVTGETGKPFVMTETTSALSTRGQYSNTKNNSVLTQTSALDSNDYITAYDSACVSWGTTAAGTWYYTITNDWFSGQYVWTGFDYIGEPTPKNHTTSQYNGVVTPNSSYFGIIDTAGFEKDTFYLYRSWWNDQSTTLHIVPGTWDASELDIDSNGYVDVAVYSNADKISLLLDGSEIGYATATTNTTDAGHSYQTWTETATNSSVCNTTEFYTGNGNNFYPQFHVLQSAGSELTVKAYKLVNGSYVEITDTVGTNKVSAVSATQIVATQWGNTSQPFTADGDSYAYIEFEAQDANGNFDADYDGTLTITLTGDSFIINGVDNGDQTTTAKFQNSSVLTSDTTATIKMLNGRAVAILRTNEEAGDVSVTTTDSSGYSVNGVTLTSAAESGADLTDEFEEVVQQGELVYTPTIYDEYEILKANIEKLGGGERDYVKYTANADGSTYVNMDIPDGWYIITGADDQGGTVSSGVMTHTVHSSGGFVSDGSTGVPAETSDAWYFEKTTGGYYIYYTDDSGTKQYLSLSNNTVTVGTSPYVLEVTTDSSGNVTIGFGSTYINFHGSDSNRVWYYSTGTNLSLYYVSDEPVTTTTVTQVTDASSLDGQYIITGADGYTGTYAYGAMTHTTGSGGMIPTNVSGTPAADDENIWIFEPTTGGYYIYYLDTDGSKVYLNVADGNISTSSTAAVLTVSDDDGDNMVIIGDSTNSYQLNYYGNTQLVGEWNPGTELTLYKVETLGNTVTTYEIEGQVTDSTELAALEDGWYILKGAGWGNISTGAITHTAHSSGGLQTDSTSATAVPTTTDNVMWYFESQSDGTYYIYYIDVSGTKQYMTLTTSTIDISTTPQALTVTASDSTITIGASNGYYVDFCGNSNHGQHVATWTSGTSLYVYKVNEIVTSTGNLAKWVPTATDELLPPVEDGGYVIYNLNHILSYETKTNGSNTGIVRVSESPSSDIITTDSLYEYTFTLVDGTTNQYYIQNSEGKYLSMGSGNGTVTFSDTATALYVYGRDDGTVNIYNDSYLLDNFQDANDMFSCWSSSTSSAGSNQIFTLYRNETGVSSGNLSSAQSALLTALSEGATHAPGVYSTATYNTLFAALEAGYETFNSATATDDDYTAAAQAINDAVAGLAIEYKYIPTTIYKYGYVPGADSPYSIGGEAYNEQTMASLKAAILADDNLMTQIKEAIGYDTRTDWGDDTYKEDALEAAVDAYAEIYSLLFTGYTLTGGSVNLENYAKTAWNRWTKENTMGAGETNEEGASVQGLFSALLVDGLPADHADYTELPYNNIIPSDTGNDTSAGITLTITISSTDGTDTTEDIVLPALEGISVHHNDIFKKEIVLVDENDETQGYSKFYWDLEFPFVVSTNEYGINTYNYSSSNGSYVFQATYDDATNSATAALTPVDDWSINLAGKGAGKGFFPFNYQNNTTTFTGENAIYHFGMSFTTDFYLPNSGTYADGEDVIFNFRGDDDVLVYIDDVLVLDNGGLHGARTASINFTDASLNYQYAMDVTEGEVKSTVEYGTTYTYGEANEGISADNLAALAKLNEVRTDGDHHTFTFFYLERGSTDSNCEITFNIQQVSEDVKLNNQTLVIDYGHPVTYNITDNNYISEAAQTNDAGVEYVGITASNTDLDEILAFDPPDNLTGVFDANNTSLDVEGLNFGECTVNSDGELTFTPTTIKFTGRDYFYSCARVTNDPTYSSDTEYYQYERTAFIPATSIYFEDNYANGISFTDGATASGFDNSTYEYGVWKTVGTETAMSQAADLADDDSANPYGYDPAYENCTEYSAYSAHMVSVSQKNNPKSSISGGSGASWPTAEFEFTGTGFDIISLTDSKSGVFYLDIYDENNVRVGKKRIVDNYYGYTYGQLYANESGDAVLDVTDKPLYNSILGVVTTTPTYFDVDDGKATQTVTYYDVSGNGYTETPTYYDENGALTEDETDSPAYAYNYAYGWVESSSDAALYQIPVMKVNDLEYGNYRVVITCAFTDIYKHYETDADGNKFYNLYIDAIRIYDPAGKDDDISDDSILQSFKDDDESYPNYLEIKDMLIGANSLSQDASTQGIIFIDGIAASDNDLDMYKNAGPNNELYLARNQAVAFEIWATAVPDDVQIGVKSATGTPVFTMTYGANTVSTTITSATEMNRSLNAVLPVGGKLAWTNVEVDGKTYYTSGVVVIQNTSDAESVLSLTSMKWTFTGAGAYGHYAENYDESTENLTLMSDVETQSVAYAAMAMRYADLEIDADDVTVNETVNAGEDVVITVKTSDDVSSLIIKDKFGKVITPKSVTSVVKQLENENIKEWTVVLTESESGTYTYSISGAYVNGYTGDNEPVEITVTVSAPEGETEPTFFEKVIGFFKKIFDFFVQLLSYFGVELV